MTDEKPLASAAGGATAPTIETDRLRLRMFRPDDLDNLTALFADPEVMRYVGNGQPADKSEAEKALISIIAHWQRNGFGRWAVEDRYTREFIGYGGLRSLFGTPELVYHLAHRHWGKGLATEMARAFLDFGFMNRRFARVVAIAKPENTASIHVMEKLRMHLETRTSYYGIEVLQYEIAADDFKSSLTASVS